MSFLRDLPSYSADAFSEAARPVDAPPVVRQETLKVYTPSPEAAAPQKVIRTEAVSMLIRQFVAQLSPSAEAPSRKRPSSGGGGGKRPRRDG